jgi:AraC family transcriptional regulator
MKPRMDVTPITSLPGDLPALSGSVLRWRRVGGLALAEVHHAGGHETRVRVVEAARFVFVVRGGGEVECGGRRLPFRGSSVVFEPAGYASIWRFCADTVCLAVAASDAFLDRTREAAAAFARPAVVDDGMVVHLARRLYGEFRLRDEVSRLAVESLVIGVLAEAARRQAQPRILRVPPAWLLLVLEILDSRFTTDLGLRSVAAEVGVHPVHLARTFRQYQRCTVTNYVRRLRVDFACRQLALSDLSLTDVALTSGFCDHSHLCRHLKRETGLTPARYRRLHRGSA